MWGNRSWRSSIYYSLVDLVAKTLILEVRFRGSSLRPKPSTMCHGLRVEPGGGV